MSILLRSSALAGGYYRMIERHFLPRVLTLGVTPNQMTVAGTGLALFVPLGFLGHPAIGLLVLLLSAAADSVDGVLARSLHSDGPFGAFLDSSLDRLSDGLYLIGFWILFLPEPGHTAATVIMFAALILTLMISYVKARAEALNVRCGVGFMERGVRVLYLIVWALFLIFFPNSRSGVLWVGLWVYLGLISATVVQRIIHIQKQMVKG